MVSKALESIINKAKPLYQKVIDKKVITFMYWFHFIAGLVALIIMITGLTIVTPNNKSIAMGLSISGIVLVCLFILTFYSFEYMRRRANMYFSKVMNLSNVMEIVYDHDLVYNTSNQVEANKESITRFVATQVVETYMTKEMDFINLAHKQQPIELGYFIAAVHDIIKHDNPNKTYLFINKPFASNQDFYISNQEAREYSYKYCFKEGNTYFYSNEEKHPSKQLINLIKKLHAINTDISILIHNNNIYLFLCKPNTYLMLGHKSYGFWKDAQVYLKDSADHDAQELKDIIATISCNQ